MIFSSQVITPEAALMIAINNIAFEQQKYGKQCYRVIIQIEIIHKLHRILTNRSLIMNFFERPGAILSTSAGNNVMPFSL